MAAVEAPPADRVDTGAPLPRGDGFGPYLVALARRGWRQLTSMRTALVLLFLLAVAAIPGSLLPQRSLNIEKVNTYLRTHGALGRTLETDDPLQVALGEAVRSEWARYPRSEDVKKLVHGDYWPGNLLWRRGRLVGVIDWEQPRLGDPTQDVATARGDLAVLYGPAAADAFVEYYLAAGGQPLSHAHFWELLICTWAVPEMPAWAQAYRALGRADLTSEVATERIRAFAARVLEDG